MKSNRLTSIFKITLCSLFCGLITTGLISPAFSLTTYAEETESIHELDILTTMIEKGYLIADESTQTVKITEKYKTAVLENLSPYEKVTFTDNSIKISPIYQTRANSGVNKFVWTWKGFDVYLDHNICSIISNGGSTAAALATFIPDPTVSKVVAVAIAAASGLISYNDHGKGVIIAFARIPGQTPIPHWISSQ